MTLAFLLLSVALPQEPARMPPVVVTDTSLVGSADSSSEGVARQSDLADRPVRRPAEVLEVVPGLVVTQHSGAGKANQLFARGFNLDHGTDLRTTLFGVPMNLPSHAHGQGYSDLNLLIPELVDTVRWRLGPIDVADGDFASAGAVDIDYVRRLPMGFVRLEAGMYGYARTVAADSVTVGGGDLLAAVELQADDGRFTVDQDYRKRNVYLSWSTDELRVAAFGHAAQWTSTDQIPERAVRSGQLGRFDSLDASDGGETSQFGATVAWTPHWRDGEARVSGYAFTYGLDLWSNFTYALDDPLRGDQFEQRDRRTVFGYDARRSWWLDTTGDVEFTVGSQLRTDLIRNGLHRTQQRERFATIRTDRIGEVSLGAFAEMRARLLPWVRGHVGVRGDQYWFDVDSDNPANTGRGSAGIVGGKAGLVFGPWDHTELYANVGTGFHSNDARGVTTRDDPTTPAAGDGTPVDPLVASRGAQIGARTSAMDGLEASLSLWAMELDSELVFVGDAGGTEPSRASRRVGVELASDWHANDWLTLDGDVALARARFRGGDGDGDEIPGALPLSVALGATVAWDTAVSTSLRLRHQGRRPLTEDGAVRASSTTTVDASLRWRIDERREFGLEVLNLLDSRDSDIEYYYTSQLPGEGAPVDDVHFHPVEPFAIRLWFTARF